MTEPKVHELPQGSSHNRPDLSDYSPQVLRTMAEMLRRRPGTDAVRRALAWIDEELGGRDG